MNYFVYSDKNCLLKINKEKYEITKNELKSINFENEKNFVEVAPLNTNNYFPYYLTLELHGGTLKSNDKSVQIVELNGENYVILLKSKIVASCGVLEENSFFGKYFKVINDDGTKLFCDGKSIFDSYKNCAKAEMYVNKEFLFVIIDFFEKKKLLVYDKRVNNVINEDFDILEDDKDGFAILDELKDLFNHGIVKKYKFENDNIELKERYSVYLKETNKEISKNDFCKAFLDCIRAENIKELKKLCTSELKSKISIKNLKGYFGEFDFY
ncbi:MAG: hypothetical protein KBT30_02660, partial [Clostridiales bacterium]|nr:hypothetical protein [Candidatus Apopatousia equi]